MHLRFLELVTLQGEEPLAYHLLNQPEENREENQEEEEHPLEPFTYLEDQIEVVVEQHLVAFEYSLTWGP